MSLFDLLFIALFLTAVVCLAAAACSALLKQFRRALRILQTLAIGAAVYMAVVIVVSLILPRKSFKIDQRQCFDDWCITVLGLQRVPGDRNDTYNVDMRLSSRARRVSQRENNLAVYLTDGQGIRYDPVADSLATPFNVLLAPGESVAVRRSFVIPARTGQLGLIITHQGGFPIEWFIIGYNTWFRKPPLLALP